jgi:hypothetical protein
MQNRYWKRNFYNQRFDQALVHWFEFLVKLSLLATLLTLAHISVRLAQNPGYIGLQISTMSQGATDVARLMPGKNNDANDNRLQNHGYQGDGDNSNDAARAPLPAIPQPAAEGRAQSPPPFRASRAVTPALLILSASTMDNIVAVTTKQILDRVQFNKHDGFPSLICKKDCMNISIPCSDAIPWTGAVNDWAASKGFGLHHSGYIYL